MKRKRFQFNGRPFAAKRSESGSITVVFIALLAIMMILVVAESRALVHLRLEVKFLEQQQIKRLNSPSSHATAATPAETR